MFKCPISIITKTKNNINSKKYHYNYIKRFTVVLTQINTDNMKNHDYYSFIFTRFIQFCSCFKTSRLVVAILNKDLKMLYHGLGLLCVSVTLNHYL